MDNPAAWRKFSNLCPRRANTQVRPYIPICKSAYPQKSDFCGHTYLQIGANRIEP